MGTDEKGLTVKEGDSRIAAWGERDEVREIARRIQLMAPGAKRLKENEALALAQGAVAHGLDPFNGEIWYIPDSGLMAGIKGLRKAARRQVSNFWPEFEELTDPDRRRQLFIPDGALAYRCILRDSETISAYASMWKELQDKGVPIEAIPTIIGKRPYVEGIGYYTQGERTKMDPVQVAMKRAEADALKRRFDLPFAIPTGEMEIVDADWAEETPAAAPPANLSADETAKLAKIKAEEEAHRREQAKLSPDEIVSKGKAAADSLYPQAPSGRRRPIEVRTFIQGKIASHRAMKAKAASGMAGLLMGMIETSWTELSPKERESKRRAALLYLFGRSSGKELDDAEVLGLRDYLEPAKAEGGWRIEAEVQRELWDVAIEGALLAKEPKQDGLWSAGDEKP